MRTFLTATAALAFWASGASAADICKAVALRNVSPIGNPDYVIHKGEFDTAITQFNVNKETGETSFCSHGGSCYPTHIQVGDAKVEALRLVNCSVDRTRRYEDGDEISYEMKVTREAVPAALLRKDDLGNRLLAMGLCSACADNVAQYYLTQPKSQCAVLTRRALEGDPVATAELQSGPMYCVYKYK